MSPREYYHLDFLLPGTRSENDPSTYFGGEARATGVMCGCSYLSAGYVREKSGSV